MKTIRTNFQGESGKFLSTFAFPHFNVHERQRVSDADRFAGTQQQMGLIRQREREIYRVQRKLGGTDEMNIEIGSKKLKRFQKLSIKLIIGDRKRLGRYWNKILIEL